MEAPIRHGQKCLPGRRETICQRFPVQTKLWKGGSPSYRFREAAGEVVITMDSDLQDSPDEIPELVRMIRDEGFDIVSGWKKKRYDPFIKRTTSKFYNATARWASGIKLHDFNCGLKAYRIEVVKSIEVFGEMHRYIPMLAKEAGFHNIGEKVVEHRSRKYGVTKYGLDRFVKGYLDLLTIGFITRFGKSPMHLFGSLGTMMFIIGFGMAGYLGIRKLCLYSSSYESPPGYRQSLFLYRTYCHDHRVITFPDWFPRGTNKQELFRKK